MTTARALEERATKSGLAWRAYAANRFGDPGSRGKEHALLCTHEMDLDALVEHLAQRAARKTRAR